MIDGPIQTDVPPLFQRHSNTSAAAAASLTNAATLRERVYTAIVDRRGLTDEEGIAITGIASSTYRPRRVELMNAGRIKAGGTRKTASGRTATVWIIA